MPSKKTTKPKTEQPERIPEPWASLIAWAEQKGNKAKVKQYKDAWAKEKASRKA